MPSAIGTNAVGRFILAEMRNRELTLREVEALTVPYRKVCYETLRKVSLGMVNPREWVLHSIAKALKLDEEQLVNIARDSDLKHRLGSRKLLKLSPQTHEFDAMLQQLNAEQIAAIRSIMEAMVAANLGRSNPLSTDFQRKVDDLATEAEQ